MITRLSPVVLLFIICVLLVCDTAIHLVQAQQKGAPASVTAQQFVLVDGEGRVTAKLSNAHGRYPLFQMFDNSGRTRLLLAVNPDTGSSTEGAMISLLDPNQVNCATLALDSTGSHIFVDRGPKQIVELAAYNDGSSLVNVTDSHGTTRLSLGCPDGSAPKITLFGSSGKTKDALTESGLDMHPVETSKPF